MNPCIMGQSLRELPLTYLDLETTGLAPAQGHRICEIALLRVCHHTIESSYTTLINPQRPIDPGAFAVNRITSNMLEHAPLFSAIVDTITHITHDTVLIAHNAPFDIAFLHKELHLLGYPMPDNPVIDTLILARQLIGNKSHSLQALARYWGVPTPTHRAMSDVITLRGIFAHLLDLMDGLEITTLEHILRYQRGLLPGDPEPTPPPLIAQAIQEHRLLRITYRSRSSPYTHQRIIRPLELAVARGELFLRAYCHLRKDMRSFAIKKIEMMRLEGE